MYRLRKLITRVLPEPIVEVLRKIKAKIIFVLEYPQVRLQPILHRRALNRLCFKAKQGETIKVIFFATFSSMWKYDELYKLLLNDKRFDPIVLVCPIVYRDYDYMINEMNKSFEMFRKKNFTVLKAYDERTKVYLDVKQDLQPDIIFYTNPYKDIIDKRYYITHFKNVLTCYVRYGFGVSEMPIGHHDLLFHNILWRFFSETEIHQKLSILNARNKGSNVVVTGYPGIDNLQYGKRPSTDVWKNPNTNLKRIIWAPHFTIKDGEGLNYSTFLQYHQVMIDILNQYREKIQIAFKPHPGLLSELYAHKDWGVERTNWYYSFWENSPNGQLETSDYIDLFNTSDAMILDSSSFVAEYLFCGKPSIFTFKDETIMERFNEFGKLALMQHYHAKNKDDILIFIEMLCSEEDPKQNDRKQFYNKYLKVNHEKSGSENIYSHISNKLFG